MPPGNFHKKLYQKSEEIALNISKNWQSGLPHAPYPLGKLTTDHKAPYSYDDHRLGMPINVRYGTISKINSYVRKFRILHSPIKFPQSQKIQNFTLVVERMTYIIRKYRKKLDVS